MEAPDWAKLWLGNESPDFLIEIALRSVVMYVALMLWLRLLGRRTLGQLSILEFGMVIILGSAAGGLIGARLGGVLGANFVAFEPTLRAANLHSAGGAKSAAICIATPPPISPPICCSWTATPCASRWCRSSRK